MGVRKLVGAKRRSRFAGLSRFLEIEMFLYGNYLNPRENRPSGHSSLVPLGLSSCLWIGTAEALHSTLRCYSCELLSTFSPPQASPHQFDKPPCINQRIDETFPSCINCLYRNFINLKSLSFRLNQDLRFQIVFF